MRFSEIIGQQKAKDTFSKFLEEGRVPHALILKGAEGIGKLAFGNAIAQRMNCLNPQGIEACGECSNCTKINKGIHPDIRFILPVLTKKTEGRDWITEDYYAGFRNSFFKKPHYSFREWVHTLGGVNKQLRIGIHEIRDLKRKVSLRAFEAEYKVVIIWNAEKIKREGANALLKLLEEPPDKTIILLTVSDPTLLLSTINSRCQRLQLHGVSLDDLKNFLIKNYQLGDAHALQVAQLSEGSLTRAVELVEETNQNLSELYQNWLRICLKGDHEGIQKWVEVVSKENKEFQKLFMGYAIQKLRDSMLFSFNLEEIALVSPDERKFHQDFSAFINHNGIQGLTKMLDDSLYYISRNANSNMVLTVLSLKVHSLLAGKVLI